MIINVLKGEKKFFFIILNPYWGTWNLFKFKGKKKNIHSHVRISFYCHIWMYICIFMFKDKWEREREGNINAFLNFRLDVYIIFMTTV